MKMTKERLAQRGKPLEEALSGGWLDGLRKGKVSKGKPLEVSLRDRTKTPLTGDRCHKRVPVNKAGSLYSRAAKLMA